MLKLVIKTEIWVRKIDSHQEAGCKSCKFRQSSFDGSPNMWWLEVPTPISSTILQSIRKLGINNLDILSQKKKERLTYKLREVGNIQNVKHEIKSALKSVLNPTHLEFFVCIPHCQASNLDQIVGYQVISHSLRNSFFFFVSNIDQSYCIIILYFKCKRNPISIYLLGSCDIVPLSLRSITRFQNKLT